MRSVYMYLVNISQKVCLRLMPKDVETQCWVAKTVRYEFQVDGPATANHRRPKLFRW